MLIINHNINYISNIIIIVISSAYFTNVLSNPVNQDTIFDVMINDNQTCDTLKKFINSTKDVPETCNIVYSPNITNLKDADEFLCFGIYDAVSKVCQASFKGAKLEIPSGKEVQMELSKESNILLNNINSNHLYCQEFVKKMVNPHASTKNHVKFLAEKFNSDTGCIVLCITVNESLNPLCAVLHMLYKFIDTSKHENLYGTKVTTNKINSSPVPLNNKTAVKINNNSNKNAETKEGIKKELQMSKENNIKQKESVQLNAPKAQESTTKPLKKDNAKPENQSKISKVFDANKAKIIEKTIQPQETNLLVESDNTGIGIESPNTGIFDEKKKKEEQKEINEKNHKELNVINSEQEPSIRNQENNKMPEDRMPVANPDDEPDNVNPDDYTEPKNDDEGTHSKDESEKSDQNQLAHLTSEVDADSSHIFLYFTMMSLGCIILYIMYLSKQKILATFAKLRRSRNRNRRRPSTANYRKLDCTLEEAVTSQCNANVTHVIY